MGNAIELPKASEGLFLDSLIESCRPDWSLPQPFYTNETVYRADLDRIWRRGWLFAGHTCQIPNPGDYFTFEVDVDSILVIRGDDGAIHALHNVCRHRGMRLCSEPIGSVRRIVCPYHQWGYARDGRLMNCRSMPEDFDRSQFGLHPVRLEHVEGMIYVSLAADPAPFGPARAAFADLARPQGFDRAKVAKIVDYVVPANWKLVWENNRECWHCNVNHPQYIKANFDHYNADDTPDRIRQEIAAAVTRSESEWDSAGLAITRTESGMTPFPDAENNVWYSANRTPLVDGYVSETMDGRQVAPLMGDYSKPTVGTLRMRSLPNFWNHSSCDHAVTTRLLPGGPHTTLARVLWLVDRDAVEGRDYDLATLLPFWQLTSEQDWELCKGQQQGVSSSAYAPGPYSLVKEYNVASFVRWYLQTLTKNAR
jgi:glycine betaine catabolism A